MSVARLRHLVALAVPVLAACSADRATPLEVDRPSLITRGGTVAGAAHPEVVLLIFEQGGEPAWRCSGALISPTVVLTAGHCTGEPGEADGARAFLESDVQNGTNNYPFAGPNTVEAVSFASHPDFTNAQFTQHDVGVVVLSQPVALPAGASYAALPAPYQLESLRPGRRSPFTAVGYGVQRINPAQIVAERVRMIAEPWLLQINTGFTGPNSLMLSNNASTGGTCFGDSGGPNYLGSSNTVGGVTSFGINGNCAGTGGVFRMDRPDVLAFVNSFLD
jgi:hypothetical protein